MSFVRDLYADLIEMRLWPVALGLLVAIVAIPVLLAKPAGESTPAGAPPADNALLGADAAGLISETKSVVVLGGDGGFRKHVARLARKDPFIPQAKVKVATTSVTATVEGAPGSTTTPTTTVPGSTAPAGAEQPAVQQPAEEQPAKLYQWVANVKFGKIDETKKETVKQAEFMPSENNPVLLFLGADESGKKARFLVSSEATARGDGTCMPSESNCQIVSLSKGDIEFFEVALSAETVITYELELSDIKLHEVKNASTSQRNTKVQAQGTASKPRHARKVARTRHARKLMRTRHARKVARTKKAFIRAIGALGF